MFFEYFRNNETNPVLSDTTVQTGEPMTVNDEGRLRLGWGKRFIPSALLIDMPRPQSVAHPVRDLDELGRIADLQGALPRQGTVNHIRDPPRAR